MRAICLTLVFISFSFFLNGQINKIFEYEILEFEIAELTDHSIIAHDSNDGELIFILSLNASNNFLTTVQTDGTFLSQKNISIPNDIVRLNVNEQYVYIADDQHNLYQFDQSGNLLDMVSYFDSVVSLIDSTNTFEPLASDVFYASGNMDEANFVVAYRLSIASNSIGLGPTGIKVVNYNFSTKTYSEGFNLNLDISEDYTLGRHYEIANQGYVVEVDFQSNKGDVWYQYTIELDDIGNLKRIFMYEFDSIVCVENRTYNIGYYGGVEERNNLDFFNTLSYKCYDDTFGSSNGTSPHIVREIDCERSIIGSIGVYCGLDSLISADYTDVEFPSTPYVLLNKAAFYEFENSVLRIIDYKNNSCVDLDLDGYSEVHDCDEANNEINPGIMEIVGNDIDENCDGIAEVDEDGDGYTTLTDCNDNDPNIGSTELPLVGTKFFLLLSSIGIDINADNAIDCYEALLVDTLIFDGRDIGNELTGLTAFKNLEYLHLEDADIDSIDLTGLNRLKYLNLGNNRGFEYLEINSLDSLETLILEKTGLGIDAFSGANFIANLKQLNLADNNLSSLDLPSLDNLETLNLRFNKIVDIDVSHLTQLKYLDLAINDIETVDLDNLTLLEHLDLLNNNITDLILCDLKELKYLNLEGNEIIDLESLQGVDELDKLSELILSDNTLTEIDLSNLEQLISLELNQNSLDEVDLKNLSLLEHLEIGFNPISSIDFSNQVNLKTLLVSGTQISDLNLCNSTELTTLNAYQCSSLESININNGSIEAEVRLFSSDSLKYICADFDQIEDIKEEVDNDDVIVTQECVEFPYNGLDDDCDPSTLDDDLDGDGYLIHEDCNDNNPDINPEAEEILYDGLDNDCDPATLDDDLDQDGFNLADDCNDEDPNIYPGAPELAGNGIDEDCDGEDWILSSTTDEKTQLFVLYPSPATDMLYVESQDKIKTIDILTLNGKRILTQLTGGAVDVSAFQEGMYVCRIVFENGLVGVKKLLID